MTEAEAKKKWCCGPPMVVFAAKIAARDMTSGPNDGCCVGSDCMAWRWGPKSQSPHGYNVNREGRCGLAGGP